MTAHCHESESKFAGVEVPDICFDEVIERAKIEVGNRHLSWRKYPKLVSKHDSFNIRMQAIEQHIGTNEKINFSSEVKKFVKARCLHYEYRKSRWGSNCLFTKITPDIAFGVEFETIHHWGLGKAFTARLILDFSQGDDDFRILEKNLFSLYGDALIEPCWTYSTKVDLLSALESAVSLINEVMPILERHVREFFSTIPSSLPGSITCRGALTAWEAFGEAVKVGEKWASDAALTWLNSSCHLRAREELGPAVDVEGRIRSHGAWSFGFCSRSNRPDILSLVVNVPFAGSISRYTQNISSTTVHVNDRRFTPITGDWIDSEKAIKIAEANGGKASREAAKNVFDIIMSLSPAQSPDVASSIWKVNYLIVNAADNRADLEIHINAVNGKLTKPSSHM